MIHSALTFAQQPHTGESQQQRHQARHQLVEDGLHRGDVGMPGLVGDLGHHQRDIHVRPLVDQGAHNKQAENGRSFRQFCRKPPPMSLTMSTPLR